MSCCYTHFILGGRGVGGLVGLFLEYNKHKKNESVDIHIYIYIHTDCSTRINTILETTLGRSPHVVINYGLSNYLIIPSAVHLVRVPERQSHIIITSS